MADHYVAINDGIEGEKYNDFITGVANTVGVNQIELRIQDGTNLSKKDVHLAPKSIRSLLRKCAASLGRWLPG